MSTINAVNPKVDQTVRIFDQFYQYEANVPVQEYEVVQSFFQSIFLDAAAADNFATTIFRVAEESGESALQVLEQFQGKTQIEVTTSLCYYLNGVRSPATLLGVMAPATPNFYTARNVRP